MVCDTCGGARFSEHDYPHHLVEGLDTCLCDEEETECRQPGCTKPATTETYPGWWTCDDCRRKISE